MTKAVLILLGILLPAATQAAEPSWLMPPISGTNLHYETFYSNTVSQLVSYVIFLPPGYDTETTRRYPVSYWLHGIGGSQTGVPTMATRNTNAINTGKVEPFIVVYVNGMVNSGYTDEIYPVETVTITELIPHIDATYRTINDRNARMAEGFSMGGAGAGYWGFKYPELFGSVAIMAGAHIASPSKVMTALNQNIESIRGRTLIRVAVGESDGLLADNTEFHQELETLSIVHEFSTHPGVAHSPNPIYDALGENNWPFYNDAFREPDSSVHGWKGY